MTGTLYSLQLLRFIAAGFVVLGHASFDLGLPDFGNFGVDIFFAISGFIIYHVTREPAPHFLLRRIIRVVPLYWLGTLMLGAVAYFFPSALNTLSFDTGRFLASLFFFPVWDAKHEFHPLLLLGWTLNFEMLFYLVFAISMRISHTHRLAISAGVLGVMALLHPFTPEHSALFFWTKSFVVEFIYGMLIAWALGRDGVLARMRTSLPVACVVFIAYTVLLYPSLQYPTQEDFRFITVGVPSAILVLVILTTERAMRERFAAALPSIALLGDLSYSLYIFHPYVLGAVKRVIGLDRSILIHFPIVLMASCVVAALTFSLFENPARRYLMGVLKRSHSASSVRVEPAA
jgi:exopolysaccharide production protein ExoZ